MGEICQCSVLVGSGRVPEFFQTFHKVIENGGAEIIGICTGKVDSCTELPVFKIIENARQLIYQSIGGTFLGEGLEIMNVFGTQNGC